MHYFLVCKRVLCVIGTSAYDMFEEQSNIMKCGGVLECNGGHCLLFWLQLGGFYYDEPIFN